MNFVRRLLVCSVALVLTLTSLVRAQLQGDLTQQEMNAYYSLIAPLPQAEKEWESTLEASLTASYFPGYVRSRLVGQRTSWDYVHDVPGLPRVLIIGDSISLAYTTRVQDALAGKANVHRAPKNCGPTTMGLNLMDQWIGTSSWDIILFNFGIHDAWDTSTNYKKNLEEVVRRLSLTDSQLLWARTTPFVLANLPNQQNAVALNAIADDIMASNNIPMLDLYGPISGHELQYQLVDKIHYNEQGKAVLSATVVQGLNGAIATLPEPAAAAMLALPAIVTLARRRGQFTQR